MLTQSELSELGSRDLRSLTLLRQNVTTHFALARKRILEGSSNQAEEVVARLEQLTELLMERMADLLEIDSRRTIETVMLLEKLRHYEPTLFDSVNGG